MSDEGYKLIQDWHDYDQSLISTLGEKYYKAQGIKAYANNIGRFIPSEVSTCFAHAMSIAKMLEKINENTDKSKLKVLDLGCGSGIFTRNLALAIKKLGFIDKVEFILADFSKKALKDIKSLKILDPFYKQCTLIEMDALEPQNAKTLDGKNYKLEDLDFVVMNYLYDALPTKILKPGKQGFEKLQFRFLQEENSPELEINDKSVCEDLNLINKLLIDTRWLEYNLDEASDIEKEYFDYVKEEPANPLGEVIYNYAALKVTDLYLSLLNENGFVYATDMPNRFDSKSSFTVYGNSAAHDVNEALVINTFVKKGFEVFFHRDTLLNHYFFTKTKAAMLKQEKPINENFVLSSKTDIYVDLKQAINAIGSPYSKDLFRMLTQELVKIDNESCFSKVAQAQDKLNFGDEEAAKEIFIEAQKVDFLNDFNLEARISAL